MAGKDTYYFSHDYNARSDEKIKRLIRMHGMTGYGIFWSIIEDLYHNTNVLRLDYDGIAYELRADVNMVKSVINDFDLFVLDGDEFGSTSIEKRLQERAEKSRKATESINSRWEKIRSNKESDTNVLRPEYERNTIKERKGKEKKENKIDFELFWSAYPVKVGKAKCKPKWDRLPIETQQLILDRLPAWLAYKPFPTYNHPNPETFFNQKRWEDEIKQPNEIIKWRMYVPSVGWHIQTGTQADFEKKKASVNNPQVRFEIL